MLTLNAKSSPAHGNMHEKDKNLDVKLQEFAYIFCLKSYMNQLLILSEHDTVELQWLEH